MNTNKNIIAASIISLGICILGYFINSGFSQIANKGRMVTVKGLSEKAVPADKVTWPIVSKELGNDLPELYSKIDIKTKTIKEFLLKGGIKENEININPPKVLDLNAERYNNSVHTSRYNITSVITVTSRNVKLVREIIAKQGELLKEGIAIINDDYENAIIYDYTAFNSEKPKMMAEAIKNAENTASQFAKNSNSKINKIENASQGQFTIESTDANTPYIKNIRVVTTVTYSLKD